MKENFRISQKTLSVLLLLVGIFSLLAIFTLAAGLDSIQLSPGQRFSIPTTSGSRLGGGVQGDFSWLLDIIIIFGIIIFIGGIFLAVLSKEMRRVLGRYLFMSVLISAVIMAYYLRMNSTSEVVPAEEPPLIEPFQPGNVQDEPGPQAEIQAMPEIPPTRGWVRWVLSAVVVAILAGGAYWLWRKQSQSKLALEEIARLALDELHSGRSWEDTVIQCYSKMMDVVSRQRFLSRTNAMTPMDCARQLVKAGFDPEPVERLTHLFEKARYSSHHTEEQDAALAARTLQEILDKVGVRE